MVYKPSSHLALRSVQHQLKTGTLNKRDFLIARNVFKKNEGRRLSSDELKKFVGFLSSF